MQSAFTIKAYFEVFIDLEDHGITEQDILNAFGSADTEVSEGAVKTFIHQHLGPEWIIENGNIQTAGVTSVISN